MTFQFSARYALVTYSQSGPLSEWAVLNHFSSIGAECIIAREDHADGGTHLHVFCDFGRKKQSRRADFFDVEGYHADIRPSRGRAGEGWDYATKDGNIVAGGLARPGGGGLPETPNKWREIVSAESREEFFDLLRVLDPKTLVTRWSELNRYADSAYAKRHEPYVGPTGLEFELGMVPELARWGRELVEDDIIGKRFFYVLPRVWWTTDYGQSRPRSAGRTPRCLMCVMLTKQADESLSYFTVLADLGKRCGPDLSAFMRILWVWCPDRSYAGICPKRGMLFLMICEEELECFLHSRSGLALSRLLRLNPYTGILCRWRGASPASG